MSFGFYAAIQVIVTCVVLFLCACKAEKDVQDGDDL